MCCIVKLSLRICIYSICFAFFYSPVLISVSVAISVSQRFFLLWYICWRFALHCTSLHCTALHCISPIQICINCFDFLLTTLSYIVSHSKLCENGKICVRAVYSMWLCVASLFRSPMNYILICPTNLTNNVHFTRRKYFRIQFDCVFFLFYFESVRFSTHECEKNTNHTKMTPQKLNSVNAPEGCVLKNYAIFILKLWMKIFRG